MIFPQKLEPRILQGMCKYDASRNLHHMSPQPGGADVIINPPPHRFKADEQMEILDRDGFEVNLAEANHYFPKRTSLYRARR